MTYIPGVHIETRHSPTLYSQAQIEMACVVAAALRRGKLLLFERPALMPSDEEA